MKNILGREVPDFIEGYGKVTHYNGYLLIQQEWLRKIVILKL